MNIKKEKKKPLKKNVFGNDYPDPLKLTEPNHDDDNFDFDLSFFSSSFDLSFSAFKSTISSSLSLNSIETNN